MKAIVYNGPRDVAVKDVPDAKIEKPTDVLVRITTTNICGSDLHMYEGRTSFEAGRVFGHERQASSRATVQGFRQPGTTLTGNENCLEDVAVCQVAALSNEWLARGNGKEATSPGGQQLVEQGGESMCGTHHQSMEPSSPISATERPSPSAPYCSRGNHPPSSR